MTEDFNLTPTEDLVLEVLGARWRTGEKLWTFSTRNKPAIMRLRDRELVTVMHGIVENTIRASLTQAGRDYTLSDTYKTPYKMKKRKTKR